MRKISVVCPTFNSALFVENTLASVLTQKLPPHELIISDDGSSDNTVEVVENYLRKYSVAFSWRVIRNSHRGPGATRNVGILNAEADWIAFLDSDDLWEENKLELIANAINSNPDVNFICHDELCIEKNGNTFNLIYGDRYRLDRSLTSQLYLANMFSTSAVVCRRDLLIEHGGFDETLFSAQDYELWLRLSQSIRPLFVRKILGRYVIREGNITSGNLLGRMRNELRVAWMHRAMVPPALVITRFARIIISFLRQYVLARLS